MSSLAVGLSFGFQARDLRRNRKKASLSSAFVLRDSNVRFSGMGLDGIHLPVTMGKREC